MAKLVLERMLQQHGFGSRRDCRSLVRHERVLVNGVLIDDPFATVESEGLSFCVDGVEWPYRDSATLVLHKPVGYECSRRPQHYPSVLSLLPQPLQLRGVQPVGRLDADTSGLLVITDDGQLNHRLTSPKHKVGKVYQLQSARPIEAGQIEQLLAGVLLNDEPEPVRAAACRQLAECQLELTITEGKYHQVRRMLAAVGNHVERLHRASIGGFALPQDLPAGQWRWLTALDEAALFVES